MLLSFLFSSNEISKIADEIDADSNWLEVSFRSVALDLIIKMFSQ